MFKVLKNRNFAIMLSVDIALMAFSLFMAYYLRFDGDIPHNELERFASIVLWVVPLKVVSFFCFGLYKGMWRYTSIQDLKRLTKACLVGSGAIVIILILTVRFEGFPRSIFPIDFLLTFFLTGGARIGIRLYCHRREAGAGGAAMGSKRKKPASPVLIVGGAMPGRRPCGN
jgi:FlaA1/EpsC-like NDP-sugar epimerase